MSHPITQGRRIRTVNGVGYNLTWLGEREGRLCRLIFDEYPQYIDLICPERRSACVTE